SSHSTEPGAASAAAASANRRERGGGRRQGLTSYLREVAVTDGHGAGPGAGRPSQRANRLATSTTLWCPGGWLPPGFVAVVTMKSVGPGTFTLTVAVAMLGAIRSSSSSILNPGVLTSSRCSMVLPPYPCDNGQS